MRKWTQVEFQEEDGEMSEIESIRAFSGWAATGGDPGHESRGGCYGARGPWPGQVCDSTRAGQMERRGDCLPPDRLRARLWIPPAPDAGRGCADDSALRSG